MDLSMAHLLMALCINDELDLLFNNPAEDPVCLCCRCIENLPVQQLLTCNCSSQACAPEIMEESFAVVHQVASGKTRACHGETMSKEICVHGTSQLEKFCGAVFHSVDDGKYGLLPPQAFLPDATIKYILGNFYSVHEVTDLFPWLHDIYLCESDCQDLFNLCQDL
jgi:hypothetical protein